MRQLTVRHVTDELAKALKEEQRRRGTSLNQTVLDLLSRATGIAPDTRYDNGLGQLAGDWDQEELDAFERDTAIFDTVDEEMWS